MSEKTSSEIESESMTQECNGNSNANTPQQQYANETRSQNAAVGTENETAKLEKDIRTGERWLILINAALLITNIVIASIYYGQLTQMRKATEQATVAANASAANAKTAFDSFVLSKQLMEGTQEAVCAVRGDLDEHDNVEHLTVQNNGKVVAKGVKAQFELSLRSLSDFNRQLGRPQKFQITEEELWPSGNDAGMLSYVQRDVEVSFLDQQHRDEIRQTRETLVVSGELQYDNGFGTMKHRPFCQAHIAAPNSGLSNAASLVECDRVEDFLKRIHPARQNTR